MTGRLFVGVDGGATRTRILLTDGSGTPLARSEGKGSLVGLPNQDIVVERLAEAVGGLVAGAGGALPVDGLCVGLAGAGREATRQEVAELLKGVGVARRVLVRQDGEVAFHDAFGERPGILLIGGTGSVAHARTPDGKHHRVGGWGALLGDEGSGFSLGAEGLRAALRGHEGRGPATRLTPVLFEAAGITNPDELLAWSREGEKARVAALSPQIAQVAEEGDPVAIQLVEAAVQALVDHLDALRPRFGPDDPIVALVGGLVQPGGPLREHLVGRLEGVGCRLHPDLVDGARGAARLAAGG